MWPRFIRPAAFGALAAILLTGAPGHANEETDAYGAMRTRAVQIRVFMDKTALGCGVGTLVTDSYVLSARHVFLPVAVKEQDYKNLVI